MSLQITDQAQVYVCAVSLGSPDRKAPHWCCARKSRKADASPCSLPIHFPSMWSSYLFRYAHTIWLIHQRSLRNPESTRPGISHSLRPRIELVLNRVWTMELNVNVNVKEWNPKYQIVNLSECQCTLTWINMFVTEKMFWDAIDVESSTVLRIRSLRRENPKNASWISFDWVWNSTAAKMPLCGILLCMIWHEDSDLNILFNQTNSLKTATVRASNTALFLTSNC